MFYELNGTELKVGMQNFKNETVDVIAKGKIYICKMFQDDDGDIGFYFNNEPIYFHWLKS